MHKKYTEQDELDDACASDTKLKLLKWYLFLSQKKKEKYDNNIRFSWTTLSYR